MNLWFLLVSTLILGWFSRKSLRSPRSHGFFRFFAWEAIALLVAQNLPVWFQQPFSWHQIISWVLLTASLIMAVVGFKQLQQSGRPNRMRTDDRLFSLEKTTQLISTGLYRYIRHPLYTSLLLLAIGAFFKQPNWLGALMAILAILFLIFTAQVEEQENIAFFGQDYQEYQSKTKMFIPFIY